MFVLLLSVVVFFIFENFYSSMTSFIVACVFFVAFSVERSDSRETETEKHHNDIVKQNNSIKPNNSVKQNNTVEQNSNAKPNSSIKQNNNYSSTNIQENINTDIHKPFPYFPHYPHRRQHKTKLEIGKEYELYIGSLYETNGYKVIYEGINKGFHDGGIDLICKKDNEIILVQCKRWSKETPITDKIVKYLYGSYANWIKVNENYIKGKNVKAVIVASTGIYPDAKETADRLGIIFYKVLY